MRQPYMPDASPYGHIFGFSMSRNTGEEEKQGQDGKDEKEEKSIKLRCSSKLLDEQFCMLRQGQRGEMG